MRNKPWKLCWVDQEVQEAPEDQEPPGQDHPEEDSNNMNCWKVFENKDFRLYSLLYLLLDQNLLVVQGILLLPGKKQNKNQHFNHAENPDKKIKD